MAKVKVTAKVARRIGEGLTPKGTKVLRKRNFPPGVHGPKGHKRLSEFGTQLKEKQKTRYYYGVTEKQLRKYYEQALKSVGNTNAKFLELLERRLDNVVCRIGLAPTHAAARQMVSHNFILINDKKMNIPSYMVRPGDVISIKETKKKSTLVQELQKQQKWSTVPAWISWDGEALKGTVLSAPAKEDLPVEFNTKLIIEFYSR